MKKSRIVLVALAVLMVFAAVSCKEPHVHEFGDWEVTTPATCTEAGVETRECECGEEETGEIAALGHKLVGVWVKSETEGKVCKKCDVCNVEVEQKDGAVVSSETELKTALSGGVEIVLGSDLQLNEQVVLGNSVNCKIDLNGYKITLGTELLKESSDGKRGLICLYGDSCSLEIGDSSAAKTGLVDLVSGNDFDKPYIGYVFVVWPDDGKKASLTVNGGVYKALDSAISGNGSFEAADCVNITINDGEFSGNLAVYHPHNGSLVINGGKFVGSGSAVEIRAGNMNINGGRFESTATSYKCVPNGSGSTISGAAIAVAQHTTGLPINVSIKNAQLKGVHGLAVENPQGNAYDVLSKVRVEFDSSVKDPHMSEHFVNNDNVITAKAGE